MRVDPATYRAETAAAHQQFLADLAKVDPQTAVPSCPRWTVQRLAEHLASVHRWAAHVVRGGGPDVERARRPDGVPPGEWSAAAAAELLSALDETGPDAPCWVFAGTGTTAFWYRRQAHETALHTADLALATGAAASYPPALRVDAVDEVFDSMLPGQHARTPVVLDAPIAFVTTDPDHTWLVRPGEDGAPPALSALGGTAAVTVGATAENLLFGIWGRPGREGWGVDGDVAVLERFLAQTVVP